MHYAGVACEMDTIMDIARRHKLLVVEDAAQSVMASYKGRALGTIGDLGCYSFHETKNYSMGEGGAIVINNPDYIEQAVCTAGMSMMRPSSPLSPPVSSVCLRSPTAAYTMRTCIISNVRISPSAPRS